MLLSRAGVMMKLWVNALTSCVAAYRGTKTRLNETFDTSFPFCVWSTGVLIRFISTFSVLLVSRCAWKWIKMFKVCSAFMWLCFFACNEQFGNCVFHYFVCFRRQSLWASQKLPGRETELCQWGEAPKVYCKYLKNKYVFDAVYAVFFMP